MINLDFFREQADRALVAEFAARRVARIRQTPEALAAHQRASRRLDVLERAYITAWKVTRYGRLA